MNFGGRYYGPSIARFINRDPISEQGGLNLYAYCANNAVNHYDLLGMAVGGPGRSDQLYGEAGSSSGRLSGGLSDTSQSWVAMGTVVDNGGQSVNGSMVEAFMRNGASRQDAIKLANLVNALGSFEAAEKALTSALSTQPSLGVNVPGSTTLSTGTLALDSYLINGGDITISPSAETATYYPSAFDDSDGFSSISLAFAPSVLPLAEPAKESMGARVLSGAIRFADAALMAVAFALTPTTAHAPAPQQQFNFDSMLQSTGQWGIYYRYTNEVNAFMMQGFGLQPMSYLTDRGDYTSWEAFQKLALFEPPTVVTPVVITPNDRLIGPMPAYIPIDRRTGLPLDRAGGGREWRNGNYIPPSQIAPSRSVVRDAPNTGSP